METLSQQQLQYIKTIDKIQNEDLSMYELYNKYTLKELEEIEEEFKEYSLKGMKVINLQLSLANGSLGYYQDMILMNISYMEKYHK